MPEIKTAVGGNDNEAFFVGTDLAEVMAAELRKVAPQKLKKAIKDFLYISGWRVHSQATMIARKEARGVTNFYMGSFRNIGPNQDAEGNQYQQVISDAMYSLVIEYGGRWRKMPPAFVLDEWIRKVINPENPTDLRRISYAIRSSMRARSRRGEMGQKFLRSSVPGGGRVMTLNRAVENSVGWMEQKFEEKLGAALESLNKDEEKAGGTPGDEGGSPADSGPTLQADDQGNIVF